MHRKVYYLIVVVLFTLATSSLSYAAPLGSRTELDNGAVLLVAERPSIPMVQLYMLIKSGAAADPKGKEGVANLMAALLTRGTQKYSAQELAKELDALGTSLGVDADTETTTISLTSLTKNLDTSLTLLAEVLLFPTFPADELDKKRQEIIGGLKSREEDPGWVAQRAFMENLYPNHPYGRLTEGTPESLNNLTRDDVVAFHRVHFHPNNAIIAVAGDVSEKQIETLLQKHFGGWRRGEIPPVSWPEETPFPATRITLDKKVTQANVILGHAGIARSNPDYYAVTVMNYTLGGGGFGSRLMDKIREELGLVYGIYSSFSAERHAGPFRVMLQTKNSSAKQAIDESLAVVRGFIEEGPTDKEVAEAKAYLINSFPLRLVSNRDVARLLPALEFYNLGLDYPDRYPTLIGEITKEKVHAVAKTYLHPDKFLEVIVADLEQTELKQ
ncbi:MAG: M16 family metallopeptidase [Candidatus Binatia bacterium]